MISEHLIAGRLSAAEDNLTAVLAALEQAFPQDWISSGAEIYRAEVNQAVTAAHRLRVRIGQVQAMVDL